MVQPIRNYYPAFIGGPALSLYSINSNIAEDIKINVITTVEGTTNMIPNSLELSRHHKIEYKKTSFYVFLTSVKD